MQYLCPVYKTSMRQGDLSSTGISSNWVIDIMLRIKKNQKRTSNDWAMRGVAMLIQLDF